MAEDKNSFVLYSDLMHVLEKLSDEKAGKLFKIILRYVNDQNPIPDDPIVDVVFEPVKQQLKRDLAKWADKKGKYKKAGEKSAEIRRLKRLEQIEREPTLFNDVQQRSTFSTVSVSVNDSVNVNASVSVIDEPTENNFFDNQAIYSHENVEKAFCDPEYIRNCCEGLKCGQGDFVEYLAFKLGGWKANGITTSRTLGTLKGWAYNDYTKYAREKQQQSARTSKGHDTGDIVAAARGVLQTNQNSNNSRGH